MTLGSKSIINTGNRYIKAFALKVEMVESNCKRVLILERNLPTYYETNYGFLTRVMSIINLTKKIIKIQICLCLKSGIS